MSTKNASSILAREIQDFNEKRAIVLKVVLSIKARDECIRHIEEISAREFGGNQPITQEKIDQMVQEINDLRKLSIHVVETIVMWRDLFKQIGMLGVS